MISNGYNNPRIVRSPSLNMYEDIYSGGSKLLRSAGQAGEYLAKETLKYPAKQLPTIGKDIGAIGGTALSVAIDNPELTPFLADIGATSGKKLGKLAQKEINKAIDKL